MTEPSQVGHRPCRPSETAHANRTWWDEAATDYYHEHGSFLGDAELVWGPEGLCERDAEILGTPAALRGAQVLEIGGGAAQGARYLQSLGAHVVSTDLSLGMLRTGQQINRTAEIGTQDLPLLQCDGRALPFADASFDIVFTAYGVMPFVADPQVVLRECRRVLRPGGRFAYSTTHPIRWAFPDVPGPTGLTATMSYFDRTPYVEMDASGQATYAEHHRTLGDHVRDLVACGFTLVDLIEPEWPAHHEQDWGGWSPLRGRLIPGTAIFVATTEQHLSVSASNVRDSPWNQQAPSATHRRNHD